jgi:hypothetical protein
MRATFRLSSPAAFASPRMTSSIEVRAAVGDRADDVGRQVVRAHLGERAAVPAERRPDGVEHEDVGHQAS